MGLFDAIREKASELLSGASEKVGELTGDLPGAQEAQDLTQSANDVTGQASEHVTGAAEDLGATATETATGAATDLSGTVTDATDTVTGAIPDLPGEAPEPYRP